METLNTQDLLTPGPFVILDTETASLSGGVVELAYLVIDAELNVLDEKLFRLNPGRPIEPGAQAIHGISYEEVADCPTLADIAPTVPTGMQMIAHNCLTGDHEVLTPAGWVRLDEACRSGSVTAAVWNKDSSAVSFNPCATVVQKFSGDLLTWDSNYYKAQMTPSHTVVYDTTVPLYQTRDRAWKTDTAIAISARAPNSILVPSAGLLEDSSSTVIFSEDFARFLEMVRADGNIECKTSIRWAFKREEKITRCTELLLNLCVPYNMSTREDGATLIRTTQHPLVQRAWELLGEGKAKGYGPWVLTLSSKSREALLDEVQFWDGSGFTSEDSKKQILLHSSKTEDLEWLQILAVLSGRTSFRTGMRPNTRGFSRPDSVLGLVSLRANNYVKTLYPPTLTPYEGEVYCLNATTGFFLVRRNGAVWVTGNCSFDARMVQGELIITRTLCTLDLARTYVKGTTNCKLETLQRELNLPVQKSHSALGDVHTVRDLLAHILPLTGVDLNTLFDRQEKPRILSKMPIGMHKGKPMLQVPKAYRDWLLDQPDLERNLKLTLEKLRNL